jgi:hypothetical protein
VEIVRKPIYKDRMTKYIVAPVPDSDHEAISKIAEEEGIGISQIIRDLVKEFIQRKETVKC